jgi:hypothetical protein
VGLGISQLFTKHTDSRRISKKSLNNTNPQPSGCSRILIPSPLRGAFVTCFPINIPSHLRSSIRPSNLRAIRNSLRAHTNRNHSLVAIAGPSIGLKEVEGEGPTRFGIRGGVLVCGAWRDVTSDLAATIRPPDRALARPRRDGACSFHLWPRFSLTQTPCSSADSSREQA